MDKTELQGKSVAVIGLGVSGRSASRLLLEMGANVVGVDANRAHLDSCGVLPALRRMGLQTTDALNYNQLGDIDFLVVSPGVPKADINYSRALDAGIPIIGEIELACRHLENTFIGITGTNGKTTVSYLIGHILNSVGKPARVLGNAGIPLTSQLHDLRDEIIVCELSSYQLETMSSRVVDVGLVLNITPDHLDRYPSFDAYAAAKFRIGNCLKPGGKLYVEESVSRQFGDHIRDFAPKTYGYSSECDICKENIEFLFPAQYRGKTSHELENIMAAFAVCCELGVPAEVIGQAVASFEKPPHRIEFVREVRGVSFFDDSKGTNIDAVIRAVESMEGNVVLIAGGLEKGTSFSPWAEAFGERIKCICVIGQAKEKIKNELSSRFRIETCDTLQTAVNLACTIAEPGENVLLSPGCASFDMFKNYEHRGEAFKQLVQVL